MDLNKKGCMKIMQVAAWNLRIISTFAQRQRQTKKMCGEAHYWLSKQLALIPMSLQPMHSLLQRMVSVSIARWYHKQLCDSTVALRNTRYHRQIASKYSTEELIHRSWNVFSTMFSRQVYEDSWGVGCHAVSTGEQLPLLKDHRAFVFKSQAV